MSALFAPLSLWHATSNLSLFQLWEDLTSLFWPLAIYVFSKDMIYEEEEDW